MSKLFGNGLLRRRARGVEAAIPAPHSLREQWEMELVRRRESVARWRGLRAASSSGDGRPEPAFAIYSEPCLRR